MRIQASVGRASKDVSLLKRAYSLKLIADSEGDKQFISSLYRCIMNGGCDTILSDDYDLFISRNPRKKGKDNATSEEG